MKRYGFKIAKWVREFNETLFNAVNNLNTDYVFNFVHHIPAVATVLN